MAISVQFACCAADGEDVQDALMDVTGRRTVPQVFVGSQFVGGCDGESLTGLGRALRDIPATPSWDFIPAFAHSTWLRKPRGLSFI